MKPRFLAFPRNLVLTSSVVLAVIAPVATFAADAVWKGTTDSTWTDGTNWLSGTAPTYGTDNTADRLVIGNVAAAGADYNPPSGETTIFGSGRAIIIGSTTHGAANLTVSSGTLKINGPGTTGNEPIMANGVSATLLINGGNLDLTGHGSGFKLCNTGAAADQTSVMTITNGSFSSGTFDFFTGGSLGTSTVNLDGGVFALTRFLKSQGSTTSTFNLDGGTLRLRNTQTSPNVFFGELTGLQTIIEDGGVIVDTNTFNGTIAEVLEHDATLGVTPDGGLTKNGVGTLTLSGANTFTGGLIINAGTDLTPNFSRVGLSHDSAAGTGTITLADSFAELRLVGATGRSIANPIIISDTGDQKSLIFTEAGTATCSGPITINETNIDNFRVRSDSTILNLTGKISGVGGINRYAGNFVVELSNSANEFTGGAKLTVGTLGFSAGALGTTGTIIMDGGTLRWAASNDEDISSRILMIDGKAATFNLLEQNSPSYDVANVTFASAIGNNSTASLVKSGAGTLTLTQPSTYSGGTTVTAGTLEFPNGGLGTTGAVTMNGGNLRWGTGNTEDVSSRIVMVDGKNASFSTNGNNVTFANSIGNSSTGNFVKTGTAGTLTITGGNTYTGTTTVGGGTLALGADNAIPNTSNITIGAGTLDAATFDDEVGTLDVSAAATIHLGSGANLVFADSNLVDWTGGTLTITGTFVSGSSIKFATSGGLDSAQLALISSAGFSNFALDPNGFLTATAAGGFAAWQTANGTSTTIDQDHDNDGVDNGVEYFMFGNANSTGFTALPGMNGNTITWTKAASGYTGVYNTDFFVEVSDTLAAGSWVTAPLGSNPGEVEITGSNVNYSFPSGSKKFARLKVTGP